MVQQYFALRDDLEGRSRPHCIASYWTRGPRMLVSAPKHNQTGLSAAVLLVANLGFSQPLMIASRR